MVSTRDAGVGFVVARGVIAGVLATLLLGLILMTGSALSGVGFWRPLQLIGATLLRDGWRDSPGLAAFVGLLLHVGVGVAWCVLFSALTRRVIARSSLAMLGILFGAAVFLVMRFLVLPWANPWFLEQFHMGRYFIAHLVFGLALGLALPSAERAIERRRAVAAPRPRPS